MSFRRREEHQREISQTNNALDLGDIQSVCNQILTDQAGRGSSLQINSDKSKNKTADNTTKQSSTGIDGANLVKAAKKGTSDNKSDLDLLDEDNCNNLSREQQERKRMQTWLSNSVRILLEHLNRYGMCVVDDFLGEDKGSAVLEEVCTLHDSQNFQDGQLMSGGGLHESSIRSDKITWTDGITPCNSPALRHLIYLIDSIVLKANRVSNNGDLGKYKINGRTKIMVACYPGGGSHYVKHVDNPNRDGRVVTAIYYLNKDWNSETDGGSLKIYSQVNKGAVVKIEPVFDRIVFFWSDSRNPHEVLPSNRPRYAVTVWYLDEVEKRNYEMNRTRDGRVCNSDM